jgi:hypothetical protein
MPGTGQYHRKEVNFLTASAGRAQDIFAKISLSLLTIFHLFNKKKLPALNKRYLSPLFPLKSMVEV